MTTSQVVLDLLDYLGSSPTPYHAVDNCVARLEEEGFSRLAETEAWGSLSAGRYFMAFEDATLLAFVIPLAHESARSFRIVGAHTDSPNLRVKPVGTYAREKYAMVAVEVYGGVLLSTWLDRDLSLAGRALVRGTDGRVTSRLVRIDGAVARVAQLAIHLDREVNDKGLVLNKQDHMPPILGLVSDDKAPALEEVCARALGVEPSALMRLDLMLFDTVPPTVGGLGGEFVFSARLDNLAMCHAATRALVACASHPGDSIPLVALFNHEEVGSASATGAGSGLLPRVLERISLALGRSREDHLRMLASSLCLSADMAHAVHPNYADKHEARHKPALNGGPVIKINAQQRYATCPRTAALFEDVCRAAEVPVQTYVHRTDLQCGSTIGPITSTLLGIPTIDVGNPMLSMHSIREMGGTLDPAWMVTAMDGFLSLPSTPSI